MSQKMISLSQLNKNLDFLLMRIKEIKKSKIKQDGNIKTDENMKHSCSYCTRKFRLKNDLLKHIHKTHKKDKTECPYCSKSIALKGVYTHCFVKHANNDDLCNFELFRMSKYKIGKQIFERKKKLEVVI